MILRPARKRDLPAIKKLLDPWIEQAPSILGTLDSLSLAGAGDPARCSVMEADKTILCTALWTLERSDVVRVLALGLGASAVENGADLKFVRELILDWSDMGVSRAAISLPESLSLSSIQCLRSCGFIFEGICSSCSVNEGSQVLLSKHFLYRTLSQTEVTDFLKDLLVSLGCETRNEEDGFGYRIRKEYRLPFLFGGWHRITRSGSDIIVHPPARVLEYHELETLFFPLRVRGRHERPLLLPMEKKRAENLVDLPRPVSYQNSLFGTILEEERHVFRNNLAYTYPAGLKRLRKGLPLLLYVNRIGVVGTGRVEDWYLDEPKNLYNTIDDMVYFDPEDVKETAAASGSEAGKVLVIRFNWYRALRRPVTLEEIRRLEDDFNPQRTRALSEALFQAVVAAGGGTRS